jgi:hypothetical protein
MYFPFLQLNLLRETTNMLSVYLKDNTGVKYSEDFIKISVGQSPNNFPKKVSRQLYFFLFVHMLHSLLHIININDDHLQTMRHTKNEDN